MRLLIAVTLVCLVAVAGGCVTFVDDRSTADGGLDPGGDTDAAKNWTVTIVEVVDGDTVDIAFRNGSTDTVRLLGIDTPEVHASVSPGEFEGVPDTDAARDCLRRVGENASSSVRDRLAGATVTLQTDPQSDRRGGYGRLLGYIILNETNINYELVADGYARVYDSRFTQSDRFYAAETDAQNADRRVWSCRD